MNIHDVSPKPNVIVCMSNTQKTSVDQPALDELISLGEAAKICGLSHSHLRLLVRRGDIWGKRMGRDWFTSEKAVKEYLSNNPKPGPKPRKSQDSPQDH
jgi:excisionase family DNA binding protein